MLPIAAEDVAQIEALSGFVQSGAKDRVGAFVVDDRPGTANTRRSLLPCIAVFSGPLATIGNSVPLVTSVKARRKYDLPVDPHSAEVDVLRPQRLAAPVTVYVEAYSAHPLESDAAALYAPPDGWLDSAGCLHAERPARAATPVYAVELRPDDGLYPLPYMARRADGSAWESRADEPPAPSARVRQTFYPDASRIYEEIDRIAVGRDGHSVGLAERADFRFHRAAPSGGWTRGRPGGGAAHVVAGERSGIDFFAYSPPHLYREPSLAALAGLTNRVHRALAQTEYAGVQWLESSATIEDTLYWLNLTIDTTVPIVGHAAQREQGAVSADGERNIIDGVGYILSGVWRDDSGRDRLGAVLIVDQMVFASREVTKVDARPGGYDVVGGHGGVLVDMGGGPNVPRVTFLPTRRHTHRSLVRVPTLPSVVRGVRGELAGRRELVPVTVKNETGELVEAAMPAVSFTKFGHFVRESLAADAEPNVAGEVEILSRIEVNLASFPLAGFVVEGMSPYGWSDPAMEAALRVASFCGMPVVRVGRGNPGGPVHLRDGVFLAGDNLSATKARLLLMAALLKLGALPLAANPFQPTPDELEAMRTATLEYQDIFDTH